MAWVFCGVFLFSFGHIEELWSLKDLPLVLLHG